MNEEKAFLQALAENEDDTTTRLVYSDWLDERGDHEEADRQRKWPAAKAWLVQFCHDHNPSPDDKDPYEYPIPYAELSELGRYGIEHPDGSEYWMSCGTNMAMSEALQENCREFWKNWSIVTGVALPPGVEEKSFFSCAC